MISKPRESAAEKGMEGWKTPCSAMHGVQDNAHPQPLKSEVLKGDPGLARRGNVGNTMVINERAVLLWGCLVREEPDIGLVTVGGAPRVEIQLIPTPRQSLWS